MDLFSRAALRDLFKFSGLSESRSQTCRWLGFQQFSTYNPRC
jgi:hypothetical protein